MTKTGRGADDDRLRRLYRDNYDPCVRYAARLIEKFCGNSEILGVQAAEIFDEAMALYWKAGEHLLDHGDHEPTSATSRTGSGSAP